MSYDERPRVCEQVRQLQDPVDRLWWFAQLERGIEVADIDRDPRFGSRRVLSHLAEVYGGPSLPKRHKFVTARVNFEVTR